jgi:hypothetical protein
MYLTKSSISSAEMNSPRRLLSGQNASRSRCTSSVILPNFARCSVCDVRHLERRDIRGAITENGQKGMDFLASLKSLIAGWLERTREWNRHSLQTRSFRREDDHDHFYDIFLFGPHG